MDIQFNFSHPTSLSRHNKMDTVQTKNIAQPSHCKNLSVNYLEDTIFVSQQRKQNNESLLKRQI